MIAFIGSLKDDTCTPKACQAQCINKYTDIDIHLVPFSSYFWTSSSTEPAPWGLPLLPLRTFGSPAPKLGRTDDATSTDDLPPLPPHPEMNGMDHDRQWSGRCQSGSGPQLGQQL
jgi:hypothetical protein